MNRETLLDLLIEKLHPEAVILQTGEEKWRLFRSLVNRRSPNPVGDDFLKMQDELLQTMIDEKGITDIADLQPLHDNLYLWCGDITALRVGAIVNAANSGMRVCNNFQCQNQDVLALQHNAS